MTAATTTPAAAVKALTYRVSDRGWGERDDDESNEIVALIDRHAAGRDEFAVGRDAEIETPDGCFWFGEVIKITAPAEAAYIELTLQPRYDGPVG